MNRSFRRPFRRSFNKSVPPLIEPLESRELFSMVTSGVLLAMPPTSISTSINAHAGTNILAEANQPFTAVVGTLHRLSLLPRFYRLQGSINWGDGTPDSPANLVYQANGSIAVLGTHTYATAGADKITIQVTAVPPPGTLLPVRLLGTIHSTAQVIEPNGGVTLDQTAGVAFSANVGLFRSNLSLSNMTAIINWGDGTQSVGKILALPTADPLAGGEFAVVGGHTYATTGSYPVDITVYTSQPTPVVGPTAPPTILVAKVDSVIDVLPLMPQVTV